MAKTAMKIKQQRKAKFSTREYTRCRIWVMLILMPCESSTVHMHT